MNSPMTEKRRYDTRTQGFVASLQRSWRGYFAFNFLTQRHSVFTGDCFTKFSHIQSSHLQIVSIYSLFRLRKETNFGIMRQIPYSEEPEISRFNDRRAFRVLLNCHVQFTYLSHSRCKGVNGIFNYHISQRVDHDSFQLPHPATFSIRREFLGEWTIFIFSIRPIS